MNITKRNGELQEFNPQKIKAAIIKANNTVTTEEQLTQDQINFIIDSIAYKCKSIQDITVEQIQDMVETNLMESGCYTVAHNYITYRYLRHLARDKYKALMSKVADKLTAKNVVNQNANIDEFSFGGRIGETADVITKEYALDFLMSHKARTAHLDNTIYSHDLNSYSVGMHNCLSMPVDYLLKYGFNTRQTDVRPAKSIGTAFQLLAVLFQLQSLQQFGGVSSTHTDWTMVPFVRFSFFKHYVTNYIKQSEEFDKLDITTMSLNELDDWIDAHKTEYLKKFDLKYEDFRFDNINGKNIDKHLFKKALFDTAIETAQAIEGMYHNLNTLQSRSGCQLPFTSINYGTCTLPEGRMVTKYLLEILIKGIGKMHRTSIFPCGIFQYKKSLHRDKNAPNHDLYLLALKATAKRLYPNYANCDWSVQLNAVKQDRAVKNSVLDELSDDQKAIIINKINEVPVLSSLLGLKVVDNTLVVAEETSPLEENGTMGCRTWNGFDVNFEKSYRQNIRTVLNGQSLPEYVQTSGIQKDGRGNICPVTIILPELAMQTKIKYPNLSKEDLINQFLKYLKEKIVDAKDILIERFDWMCDQSPRAAKFMYENNTMTGYVPKEGVRSALKHGTLVIGQLGLAECLQILVGADHTNPEVMPIAKRIEQLYKDCCTRFKEDYCLNFGVYYTPAESLCFTALKRFVKKYGIIPHVSDRQYFTNSMHCPVEYECTPFEKIDIESQLTGYSSAGCITYVELGSSVKHNIEAMEEIVNYAMDKDIPYFAINVPNDQCCDCGYLDDMNTTCPECGGKNITRLRRVTGYLSQDYRQFNQGKQDEVEHRAEHDGAVL